MVLWRSLGVSTGRGGFVQVSMQNSAAWANVILCSRKKTSLDYVSKHTKSLKIPTGFWHLYGKKPVEVV